jgi:uroporphyrinogen-III synthase
MESVKVDSHDRVMNTAVPERPAEPSEVDALHDIGRRIASADPLHEVLSRVVHFVSSLVRCDSCFVYVLEGDALVLRASKNPHP